MRKILALACAMVISGGAQAAAEYYIIDPAHTYPHFAIDHLNFSTLYGRFDQTHGRLMIDRQNNNGFVEVEIAAVSVNTGFHKRDDHLRSPDFLNVTEFPNIKYESTSLHLNDGGNAEVKGKLTMLGVTKPVDLKVARIRCGSNPINKKDTCGFEAETQIKRSDFGSNYGLPGIGDEMRLWFQIEAVKE